MSIPSMAVPGPRQEVATLGVLGLRVGLAFVKEFCFSSVHVDIRRERSLSDM